MSSCRTTSDNFYSCCPAKMSDGRMFTDYRQNCLFNNGLSKGMGSWEYRNYLTENADSLRNQFIQSQEAITACTKCSDNTVLPVKTIINCTPEGCNYMLNDPNGLGQGRKY